MADRDLRVNVTTDARKAAADVENLSDEVRQVEGAHDVDVTVDGAQAVAEVDKVENRLDRLTAEQRRVVLTAQAAQAEAEIRRLDRSLSKFDKLGDEEIRIRLEARDNASKRLDAVQAQVREIDGQTARVDVDVRGGEQLDDILSKLGADGIGGGNLSTALRNPAALAGVLALGLGAAATNTQRTRLEAAQLSALTGDSVDTASRLQAIWKTTGADVTDLVDVLLQMGGVLAEDVELARQLGVDTTAPLIEQMTTVITALEREFPNAVDRSLASAQLFGEEGVRQVAGLTTAYGDLQAAIDGVDASRAVSDADVAEAQALRTETARLSAEFDTLAANIGAVVLPVLGTLAGSYNRLAADSESLGQTLRGVFDGGAAADARAYADELLAAEQAARDFISTTGVQFDSVDELRAALAAAGLEYHAANVVVAEWGRQQKIADEALQATARTLQQQRLDDYQAEWAEYGAQMERTAGQVDTATEAIEKVTTATERLATSQSGERSLLDLADQFDRVRQLGAEAWLANVEGAVDAGDKARDYRRAQLDLQLDLQAYIETLEDVPAQVSTRLLAQIARGDLSAAEEELNRLSGDRYVKLIPDVQAILQPVFEGVTFKLPGGGQAPEQVDPPSTVIVYNPPGSPSTTTGDVVRYGRRNGTDLRAPRAL